MRPRAVIIVLVGVLAAVLLSNLSARQQQTVDDVGRGEHDAVVERLEERAAAEDGWLTVTADVTHEGGGHITWWLAPCDPPTDDEREVTRTSYQGSDVDGEPGVWRTEQEVVTCKEPDRVVPVAGRELVFDTDMLDLDGVLAPVSDVDTVTVDDPVDGSAHTLEASSSVRGACDAWQTWGGLLDGGVLYVNTFDCVGSVGALPPAGRDLLEVPGTRQETAVERARTVDRQTEPFEQALADAGWTRQDPEDGEGSQPDAERVWAGPCGPPGADHGRRTVVTVRDEGEVVLSEEACGL